MVTLGRSLHSLSVLYNFVYFMLKYLRLLNACIRAETVHRIAAVMKLKKLTLNDAVCNGLVRR